MKWKIVGFFGTMGLLLCGSPTIAHHSFAAEFDANAPVNLKGVVTKVEWMNPHARFALEVTAADGKVEIWDLELGSPNGLMRQGWSRNTLKVGDAVAVEGSRAKNGSLVANARSVVLASTGQRLFAASSQATQQ
jgi:WD40 repeat protein